MAGTTQIYKVDYHFETGGKKASTEYTDYVSAADSSYNAIKTVLSNNNKLRGSGTLVLDAVTNVGLGTVLT